MKPATVVTDAGKIIAVHDGIVDLDEFIWDSINAVLHEENASATKEDKLLGKIETDWYSKNLYKKQLNSPKHYLC